MRDSHESSEALQQRWIQWMGLNQGRSDRTVGHYAATLRRLERYLEEEHKTPLVEATTQQLEAFVGMHLHKAGLKPLSRRPAISAVKHFYGWLFRKRLIKEDPATPLVYPKTGRDLPIAMGLSQAEKLLMQPGLDDFIGVRDTALIATMIGTGCRLSGIVGLNEWDLTWLPSENGLERLVIKFKEKGKKERLVPCPFEASLLIRAYLGHPELATINRTLPTGDKVLFVSTKNNQIPPHEYHGEARRISTDTVDDRIKLYGRMAGLPENVCHAHALRHMYGTELAEAEVATPEVMALLGHEKAETTQVYQHLALNKLVRTVERANPFTKMNAPSSPLAEELRKRLPKTN